MAVIRIKNTIRKRFLFVLQKFRNENQMQEDSFLCNASFIDKKSTINLLNL